ncbi:MAG: sulfotransferase, partial [Bryobacteraceae bacterium]
MTSPLHPLKIQSAAVRLANAVGAPLRGAISFQPEFLMDKARKFCNLADFGGGDFEEPFRILARAMDRGMGLHFTGRVLAQRELLRCLVNRLRIAEYCRRNPGTGNVAVPDPIVIAGLPRSGTTFLHRILAQDPRTRTLRTWELYAPVPPGWGDGNAPDPRLALMRRGMEWRRKLLLSSYGRSTARAIHHSEADDPEECWPLLQNSFRCGIFAIHGVGEEYTLWLREQDH